MKAIDFILFANDITGENVRIFEKIKFGKWFDCEYSKDVEFLETEKVYGIYFNGMIMFDFKTGKNTDSFFKSFVNQAVSKYLTTRLTLDNETKELRKFTKSEVLNDLKNNTRVQKHYYYTTLYGVGFFCLLMNESNFTKAKNIFSDYLERKKIVFKNEFSEAGWVFRFCINQKIETHNLLLQQFEL